MLELDFNNQRAVIRESECIGCTKCIQACPVDAIIGTNKQMHTVIAPECTGCGLCVAPCPVDCIEMLVFSPLTLEKNLEREKLAYARAQNRVQRLAKQTQQKTEQDAALKLAKIKAEIQAAIARVKAKKSRHPSNEFCR